MFGGPEGPHDSVLIEGEPRVELRINAGMAGDVATVASLVDYIPLVVQAPPGLASTKDVPPAPRLA
jgi:4-hydroxy-tetrahydrodipicolinate reductase